MISQYNVPPAEAYGVRNLMQIVGKRIRFQGFIVRDDDFGPKWHKEHQENVQKWMHEGSFKAQQHVTKGIDNAGEGFLGMLRGDNFGKAVLEVSPL